MMQFNNGARHTNAAFGENCGIGVSRSHAIIMALMVLCGVVACSPIPTDVPNSSAENTPTQENTCPAKDLQYLVGQSRTVLQTMRFGSEVRFEEPGQMYTQEFKATRTRIVIGSDGKIARILCG